MLCQDPPNLEVPLRANRRLAQVWLDALATELGAAAGTIETYTDDLKFDLTCLEGQDSTASNSLMAWTRMSAIGSKRPLKV